MRGQQAAGKKVLASRAGAPYYRLSYYYRTTTRELVSNFA